MHMSFLINRIREQTPPHQHNNYEIIVCTGGAGTFHSMGMDIFVSPGTMIIVPPGAVHSSNTDSYFERIYISGAFSHIFNITSPAVILDNSENEGTLLANMIFNNRYANQEYVATLASALAYFLLQSRKAEDNMSMIIEDIINKITSGFYDCNLNLCALLRKSGYAEDYVRAQFKKVTGKTPTEFLTKVRIDHARYLIDVYKSTLSLSEIAVKCGYTDYIHFLKRFKHITGMSPRNYLAHNR